MLYTQLSVHAQLSIHTQISLYIICIYIDVSVCGIKNQQSRHRCSANWQLKVARVKRRAVAIVCTCRRAPICVCCMHVCVCVCCMSVCVWVCCKSVSLCVFVAGKWQPFWKFHHCIWVFGFDRRAALAVKQLLCLFLTPPVSFSPSPSLSPHFYLCV